MGRSGNLLKVTWLETGGAIFQTQQSDSWTSAFNAVLSVDLEGDS